MVRKITLLVMGVSLNLGLIAQEGNVGINTENPKAALDVKSSKNDGDKVMRFTTKPNAIGSNESFVFFVGKEVNGGYDLRRVTLPEIVKSLSVEIPSLRRITVSNISSQTFNGNGNHAVKLDNLIFNASDGDYVFNSNYIELKKDGVYEVSSWVGFEKLDAAERDVVISLAKKSKGESGFTNFKRAIISRSANNIHYTIGNGVGASFSFVENFKAGDQIILHVNPTNAEGIKTLKGSVSLLVTRVTKDAVSVNVP